MRIAINKIHFPVTTLGFGRRVGIWMQGCSIRCPGCINRDTWDRKATDETTIPELVRAVRPWLETANGVTISGGEPFDQPQALAALIDTIRIHNNGDVLVYTGYPRRIIRQDFSAILKRIDVLISEPYVRAAGHSLALRGSDNQRIALLTPLARRCYPKHINQLECRKTHLNVTITTNEVWMAGIPRPGDMFRLKSKLKALGYGYATSDEPKIRA